MTPVLFNSYSGASTLDKSYIGYTSNSDGQILLDLVHRRLDLYADYTRDPDGRYQRSKNLIYRNKDIHGFAPSFNGVLSTSVEQKVAAYIAKASKQTRNYIPSIGNHEPGHNVFNARPTCESLAQRAYDAIKPNGPFDKRPGEAYNTVLLDCQRKRKLEEILNEKWEDNSLQALYEFISGSQEIKGSRDVSYKKNTQKGYITAISSLAGISRDNLVEWTRNGIIASNVRQGVGLVEPEQSIDLLITGGRNIKEAGSVIGGVQGIANLPSIGFDPATITLVTNLVKALVAAISITIALKDRLKSEQEILTRSIEEMGSAEISSDTIDFAISQSGISQDTIIALLAAVGIGGGFLWYQSKN